MKRKLVPMDRSHLPQVLAIERACFSKPWSEQTFADELYNDAVSLVVAEGEDGAGLGYGEVSVVLDEGCLEKIAVAEDGMYGIQDKNTTAAEVKGWRRRSWALFSALGRPIWRFSPWRCGRPTPQPSPSTRRWALRRWAGERIITRISMRTRF